MKLLFAAAEATPFFKSGGLADVIGALPQELKAQGIDVRVVLPYHSFMPQAYKDQLVDLTHFQVELGYGHKYAGVKSLQKDNIIYYFIDNQEFFARDSLYGYDDDVDRYSFFSMALIQMLEQINYIPDILHVNDWHTAIVPLLLKEKYHWIAAYSDIKTVLSIHNLKFQGQFGKQTMHDVLGIGGHAFHIHGLEFFGDINFLKAGIYYADRVMTVSPSYAEEIKTEFFGHGLDGVLRDVSYKLSGVLNGLDYEVNNPETDPKIKYPYSVKHIKNKEGNKIFLQEKLGLPVDKDTFVIGMVTRLTEQKGLDLVQYMMNDLMQRPVQFVAIGTGDSVYEDSFKYFNYAYPNQFKGILDFDSQIAQEIYAGSDLFLMPSQFEPCGLSQMIAMRYGSLPLVHEVGGLKDTVQPYNQYETSGNGFSFYGFNAHLLLEKIEEALALYTNQPDLWKKLTIQAMNERFSWESSSKGYLRVYCSLTW